MLNCFDNKFIITGHKKQGSTGSGVGQLYQWFIAEGILKGKEENHSITYLATGKQAVLSMSFTKRLRVHSEGSV